MTELDYEYMLDENGRCLEWYDEDFPSDISVGNNFAYTDEYPVEDNSFEDESSLESDGTCSFGLFFANVVSIEKMTFSPVHSVYEINDIYQSLLENHGNCLSLSDAMVFLANYYKSICGGTTYEN